MRMLKTPPFFPPKSGEKPYLEVFSIFGLWRDFLNDNTQATISAFRLIKNLSINPKSVEFHRCYAKPHSICFLSQYQRERKKSLPRFVDNWKHDSDLKVHALHYANELLVRVRLSFQKLLQNRSTCKTNTKKCWENSNDASIRVQTTINISIFTFLCFYDNINVKENVFFQSASWKKHCATHWRERRGWDQVIFDWFVLSMRMQVILDSSFARPGSAPIWGGKKGEFRDWTNVEYEMIDSQRGA